MAKFKTRSQMFQILTSLSLQDEQCYEDFASVLSLNLAFTFNLRLLFNPKRLKSMHK